MEIAQRLRELFSYVDLFAGERFVLWIDDRLIVHPVFGSIAADIAQLRRLGIRISIVCAARYRIDEVLSRYGISTTMVHGVRISPSEAMPLIEMAAFDSATKIMTALTGRRIDAVTGNWVKARTLGVVDGVDYLSTGTVERIDPAPLLKLCDEGIVPILPCIGWNRSGEAYNLSSLRLASDLAQATRATKLVFCVAGAVDLPARMTSADASRLLETLEADNAAAGFLSLAIDSCGAGVNRVHILDAREDGSLLAEIFSNVGVGSMIHGGSYDAVRPYRRSDAAAALRIMLPDVANGRLLPRNESELERHSDELVVYEIDGTVHGIAGLEVIEDEFAEVYGLAIDDSVRELGVGSILVSFLLERARSKGVRRVFALTTQAFDWFRRLGFGPVPVSDLPETRRNRYDPVRNSRVVAIDLPGPHTS
jgi:amino-acid N-acetyltransferase